MSTKNLLVELFVEELPPKSLKVLGEAFGQQIRQRLIDRFFVQPESKWQWFATSRRMAVHICDVADTQPTRRVETKLMPASVALDQSGNATPALLKKMQALGLQGIGLSDLSKRVDGKNEILVWEREESGFTLGSELIDVLNETVAALPIPKVMSYQLQEGDEHIPNFEPGWTTVKFVRPAHSLVVLHGKEVLPVPGFALGLRGSNTTHGHRFEASKPIIELKDADSYTEQLEAEGAVIASFAARRAEIVKQLHAAAGREGLQPIADETLLDEVTGLVERPNVLTCQFETEFLEVPAECLILTMKANQKYFPLLDANGKLTNKFLVVSNITPADPSRVIDGNERVVRPRLADAKFFYDQDRKQTLESRLPRLNKIVYHNQLGSQLERVERVRKLAILIGTQIGKEVAAKADQAAQLAKADLVTNMVGEFPELQGIMGRYYALADGMDAEVAEAIREQYLPRGAGDELPATRTGMALSLADKLETLCGIFAVGQKPTGTKDPFGLRRAAIGVLRIMIERKLPLDLAQLIVSALDQQPVTVKSEVVAEVYDYIMERLRGYYVESAALDVTIEMFDAVLANHPASPLDFDQRLHALASFLKLSDAQSLAAANKRINNILKKSEDTIGNAVHADKFVEAAERELYAQLQSAEADTAPLFATRNYADALTRLATLRPAVDQFFDKVMVMADEEAVRNNRLALLSRLRAVFLQVADLSRLPG